MYRLASAIGIAFIGSACVGATAPEGQLAAFETGTDVPTVATDPTLLGRTVCTGSLDETAMPTFGGLQRFVFQRGVYATHVDLSASLSFSEGVEFAEATGTAGYRPDARGVVSITGDFGRYDIGSDHYIGLANEFGEDGAPGSEIIRIAYWDTDAVKASAGAFVLEFNKGGSDCVHTVE